MKQYILTFLAVICTWLAPNAMADRLVSQEPRVIHRRTIVEREYLPDYYRDDGVTYRTTRVRDLDDDDDDDDDDYEVDDDDDDDDERVVIRQPRRVERRVIIRD